MSVMQHVGSDVGARVTAKLAEIQGARSDREFAALLGVTRAHWAHLKAGRRNPSYAFVKRVMGLHPELYPIVVNDLTSGVA